MRGTLVRFFFREENERHDHFETIIEALSEARHGGDYGESKYLRGLISQMEGTARTQTEALIESDEFWRFNSEFGQTDDDDFYVIELEYSVEKSDPCMKAIVEWAKSLGAEKVQLKAGEYFDEEDSE